MCRAMRTCRNCGRTPGSESSALAPTGHVTQCVVRIHIQFTCGYAIALYLGLISGSKDSLWDPRLGLADGVFSRAPGCMLIRGHLTVS